jgi:hypothetical protein
MFRKWEFKKEATDIPGKKQKFQALVSIQAIDREQE